MLSVICDDGIVTIFKNVYLLEIYAKLSLERMSSPERLTDVGSSALSLIFLGSWDLFILKTQHETYIFIAQKWSIILLILASPPFILFLNSAIPLGM